MPELPDILTYRDALSERLMGQRLETVRLRTPFLLRTVDPPLGATHGRVVSAIDRIGKRIAIGLEGDLWLVIHLMIAGRLRWKERGCPIAQPIALCAFDFAGGSLLFTEAASKKRASLHVVQGKAALAEFDRGGLEVFGASPAQFAAALRRERRTLKRALTDPTLFSGIGNSYSDEILHAARLSPASITQSLDDAAVERLRRSCVRVLTEWTERLRAEVGDGFPDKVTAFRDGMAVHGRFGKPCPVCGQKVQRIRYADNECNYCAQCQCGGKLLADRGLSTLLRGDWPKTLAELEERRRPMP
jgi:formamidopyrimidine-DNA glycosylase